MNLAEARRLFDYTEWANARMLEAARSLTAEQLDRPLVSSFPSIRTTLAHVISAEWIWLCRWRGESPMTAPSWDAGAPLDELASELAQVERERREMLDGMSEDALRREVAYRRWNGNAYVDPLGDLFTHVVNHSTYHRGQLTTMLRQVGATPPSTDFIQFLRGPRP